MYIPRAIEETVLHTSQTFPVVLVTGPRQVGKTTLLRKLGANRNYVSLDDAEARLFAKTSPALFLQRHQPPIIIDEIQYAPEILPYIKMHVDSSHTKGDIWLTGSQIFHTMKHVSESLAGRVGILHLLGLSNSEIQQVPSVPFSTDPSALMQRIQNVPPMSLLQVYDRIYKGASPALHVDSSINLETFYSSYISTYIQRDIRDLSQIADETDFYKFMTVVAARTARPVNYSELARDTGISVPTAKRWLSILVSSYTVALVQPYSNNVLKRVVKAPIMHFLDTGLCAHLLGWGNAEILERGAMAGPFFESWVFSEIYKSFLNAGKRPPIYYYRDKDKKEIDLMLMQNGTLYPIEIKKQAQPSKDAIKHFTALKPATEPERYGGLASQTIQIGQGAVICMVGDLLPITKTNWAVPAWLV